MEQWRSTTICAVKRDGKVAIAGDGQVTLGESVIIKTTAKKLRRIYNDQVVVGFAGAVADAFALCEKFEAMLNKFSGNLMRSAVELAQLWRGDQGVRNLDAKMIVANKDQILICSGVGEIMEPDDGICSIGSGSNYAYASAKALLQNTDLSAREIAYKSLKIASEICVYTNDNIIVEEL